MKERDVLYELLLQKLEKLDKLTPDRVISAFAWLQTLLNEFYSIGKSSELSKILPEFQSMFVPIDLISALHAYNSRCLLLQRKHVSPTFKEIRHIFNWAIIHSVTAHESGLQLLTLDADETIYSDGGTVTPSSPFVPLLIRLVQSGVHVALVTAAGYPNAPHRYEQRLSGLLQAFQLAVDLGAPSDILSRFHVMGGECNYLHKINVQDGLVRLEVVPGTLWKDGRGVRWDVASIDELLAAAEQALTACAQNLGLCMSIIRKERAVGMIRTDGPKGWPYAVLEEIALDVQAALASTPASAHVPYCCFNGGNDVWIDIGHKALGIRALQAFIGEPGKPVPPAASVHIGDQFTGTGNDHKARDAANTLWIANPAESEFFLSLLLHQRSKALAASGTHPSHHALLAHAADVPSAPPGVHVSANYSPAESPTAARGAPSLPVPRQAPRMRSYTPPNLAALAELAAHERSHTQIGSPGSLVATPELGAQESGHSTRLPGLELGHALSGTAAWLSAGGAVHGNLSGQGAHRAHGSARRSREASEDAALNTAFGRM